MKTCSLKIIISFLCFVTTNINAEFSSETLTINSSTIEVVKDKNMIVFNGNVFIKSKDFVINADKAIYNNINKIVYVNGTPSIIDSVYENNIFTGSADKIIFTEANEVQLIGNAQMNYDNIDISSNEISFSLKDGKITTNN